MSKAELFEVAGKKGLYKRADALVVSQTTISTVAQKIGVSNNKVVGESYVIGVPKKSRINK